MKGLVDFATGSGVGGAIVAVLAWVVARIRGSERLGRTVGRMVGVGLQEYVVPVFTDRFDELERQQAERDRKDVERDLLQAEMATKIDALTASQTVMDATMTAHMNAEDKARQDDIKWRKRRQAENETIRAKDEAWRTSVEARLTHIEAELETT